MIEEHHVALTTPTVHYTMDENATLLISNSELLARTHVDSSKTLQVKSLTNPQGTLINNNNGTWSFTPSKYFNGSVTLNCIISDGEYEAKQKVKIDVVRISHPFENPEIELLQQADGSYLISSIQLLQNGTDIEGDNLEIIDMSAPQGKLVNNIDGTWAFIPSPEYLGTIDLQFVVTDGKAQVSQNLVISVNTPVIMPEIDFLMSENNSVVFTNEDLLENTSDIDGDLLSIIGVQNPAVGEIINNDNGTWTYVPPENYVGPLQLQFGVADSSGIIVEQSINLYATSENLATMQPKTLEMQPDGTVIITQDVLLADFDVNDQILITNLATTQGTLQQIDSANNMKWIFTPNKNFDGVIDLQYTIADGKQITAHAISIEIVNELQ